MSVADRVLSKLTASTPYTSSQSNFYDVLLEDPPPFDIPKPPPQPPLTTQPSGLPIFSIMTEFDRRIALHKKQKKALVLTKPKVLRFNDPSFPERTINNPRRLSILSSNVKKQLDGLFYSPSKLRAFWKNQEGLADHKDFKNAMKNERVRINAATIHTPPARKPTRAPTCEPTIAPVMVAAQPQRAPPIAPVTPTVAPRSSTQTKAEIETTKRIRKSEERERGRRVQRIYLDVMYGRGTPASTSLPQPPKPPVTHSPYPETRSQYWARSQSTQKETAAAAFLACITAAAVTNSHRRTDAATASRMPGERQQALTRRRQRLIVSVEQNHRVKPPV